MYNKLIHVIVFGALCSIMLFIKVIISISIIIGLLLDYWIIFIIGLYYYIETVDVFFVGSVPITIVLSQRNNYTVNRECVENVSTD